MDEKDYKIPLNEENTNRDIKVNMTMTMTTK